MICCMTYDLLYDFIICCMTYDWVQPLNLKLYLVTDAQVQIGCKKLPSSNLEMSIAE